MKLPSWKKALQDKLKELSSDERKTVKFLGYKIYVLAGIPGYYAQRGTYLDGRPVVFRFGTRTELLEHLEERLIEEIICE